MEDRLSVRPRTAVIMALLAYAVFVRVLPYVLHVAFGMPIERAYAAYPWNFSPLFALAIFGGSVLTARLAVCLPLGVYLAGDVLIALLMGTSWGFYLNQPFTYAAFVALAVCGMPLRRRRGLLPVTAAGLGGTTAFFVLTNLSVWLSGGGFARPQTPAGLLQCFVDALPFFTPTLASVAVFLPILYSPLALAPVTPPAAQAA